MGKLNKFQFTTFETWKGMTKQSHLGSLGLLKPQEMSNIMVKLLAYHSGKTTESILAQFPTKEFDTADEYTWKVVGPTEKNVPLVEARTIDGTVVTSNDTGIGAGTMPFYLIFGEDYFADGEVIVGNYNEAYLFRILGIEYEGTNTKYKVELMGGNTVGCPGDRLQAGELFSVEYAPVERSLSRKVGDLRFGKPVEVRNEWTTIRIQHKVGGDMLGKRMAFGIPIEVETEGRYKVVVKDMWMHYVDWEAEVQFSAAKAKAKMFGRSNRNDNGEYLNIGKSGEVIRMGDGLLAQMEAGNTMFYNTFSLKVLENLLLEISTAKLGMKERKVIIKTGERGAIQLHKAIKEDVSGWMPLVTDGNAAVVTKTSSKLHQNSLAAGFQFTEWKGPNGIHIVVETDPWYDDPIRNKVTHPLGGVAQSYRYDIFAIGDSEHPNIMNCAIKGETDIRGYQWGFRNPFTGQKDNMFMSHDEDSATFHKMSTFGVCVLDPTRTVSLIPEILNY